MLPGENNVSPVRANVPRIQDSPLTTGGLHTGGLSTGGLRTGNLEPLPKPKFPEVGRITPEPFDIEFTPRSIQALPLLNAEDCPFGYVFADGMDSKLRGGLVSGGTGNVVVNDYTLPSSPTDGTHLYLKVDFTATITDGVLLPGGNVTAASIASGSSIPDNDIPTATAENGKLYIDLGNFLDGTFRPAGCGNFQIGHCPGSLTYARG